MDIYGGEGSLGAVWIEVISGGGMYYSLARGWFTSLLIQLN